MKQKIIKKQKKQSHNKEELQIRKIKGITLVALVITIIIIIILATVAINMAFGRNGLITKAQIAKNEMEIATLKEALNLYYINNRIDEKYENPIGEKVEKEDIKDEETLKTIVGFQYGVEDEEQIDISNMYYLDLIKLNLRGIREKRYFMDTSTGIVFINEGIELNAGKIYVLEEKDIMPITLEAQEIEGGFKLKATVKTSDIEVNGYTIYLNNEKYKEVKTNEKTIEIEVKDQGFETIECVVRAKGTDGIEYSSNQVKVDNYIIREAEDFNKLRTRVAEGETFEGKRIRIVNDIDLGGSESNKNWETIGSETTPFSGTLEGNNHKLTNIYYSDTTASKQGLLGVTNKATIQNIIIESGKIEASEEVGGIVGTAIDTQIINCHNKAEIIAVKGYVGGITGKSTGIGKIENCSNSGKISSNEYIDETKNTFIGGVVGYIEGELGSCENTGEVKSVYAAIGGAAGAAYNKIDNCNNSGTITATGQNVNTDATIGGVIGYVSNEGKEISNCTNSGSIISYGSGTGGVIGITVNSQIYNCNNNATITLKKGCNLGGVTGLLSQGKIENCISIGEIIADTKGNNDGVVATGGIVGASGKIEVAKCINKTNVISQNAYAGGIAGLCNGTIIECSNEGYIKAEKNDNGNSVVAGIVGQMNGNNSPDIKIENCHNTGNVYGTGDHVAGIIASLIGGRITNSYNIGNITSETGIVGGIIGDVKIPVQGELSNIENCYNTGIIEAKGIAISNSNGESYSGGIAGGNHGNISKCWNSGEVKGFSSVGGITGTSEFYIGNCYNKGTITSVGPNANGNSVIGGIVGSTTNNSITEYCYNKGDIISEYNCVGGLIGIQQGNSISRNSYNTFQIQEGNTKSNLVGYSGSNTQMSNCYYRGATTSGTSRLEADMKTTEFINLIGGESIWKLDINNINNGFVILNWQ